MGRHAKSNLFPLPGRVEITIQADHRGYVRRSKQLIHSAKIASELQTRGITTILMQEAFLKQRTSEGEFIYFIHLELEVEGVCNKVSEPVDFPAV